MRIDPEARGVVCAVKRVNVIWGNGSADNIRASGLYSPRKKAEDMTAPTTSATPKIALDQRAPSRHDNAAGKQAPRGANPSSVDLRSTPSPARRPARREGIGSRCHQPRLRPG